MKFKEIVEYVGVNNYPEKFEEAFLNLTDEKTDFCDKNEIQKYDEEYGVLGKYKDIILKGAADILEDEKLYLYGRTILEYAKTSTHDEIRCVPLPEFDGTIKRDVFPMLIILTFVPGCISFYKERGYDEEIISKALKKMSLSMEGAEKTTGTARLIPLYYNWDFLYIFGEIFEHDGFQYQFKKFYGGAMLLTNKSTNENVIMMRENSFHRSGLVLGSVGAEDKEGSFDADFLESDEAFCGHLVLNGKVSPQKTICKKSEWDCVLKPGDMALAVHIPKDADVSHEAVLRSFNASFKVARDLFPEHNPKYIVCYSWLLDPTLEDLMGSESRLVGFGNEFLKFPVMSNGTEYKHFVFRGYEGATETLPEDTSLRRKIKKHLLSDKYIYYTAGVYIENNYENWKNNCNSKKYETNKKIS